MWIAKPSPRMSSIGEFADTAVRWMPLPESSKTGGSALKRDFSVRTYKSSLPSLNMVGDVLDIGPLEVERYISSKTVITAPGGDIRPIGSVRVLGQKPASYSDGFVRSMQKAGDLTCKALNEIL